jgi:pimeloyl-ACP methyl ester carboxylesterase
MKGAQSPAGYNVVTTGAGQNVVLVNGIFQTSDSWEPFAEFLKDRFCVTRFDFPNQGSAPADPGMQCKDDYCAALLSVIARARLKTEDTICIGWSFGANLLTRLVLHHRISFRALVLITPAPVGYDNYMQELFNGQLEAFQRGAAFGVAQTFIPRIFSPAFVNANPGMVSILVAQFVRNYARRLGALEALLIASEPQPVQPDSRLAELPSWIIEAEDELLLPPRSLAQTARHLGSAYVSARGGHACALENPALIGRIVTHALLERRDTEQAAQPNPESVLRGVRQLAEG